MTAEEFTASWQPPSDPVGLAGYQVEVQGQRPGEMVLPTSEPSVTMEWPVVDPTHDDEVCVSALYEKASGEDGYDESDPVCVFPDRPDGAPDEEPTGEPGSEPGSAPPAKSPDGRRTTSQSPAGPSTEPTREETP